MKSRLLIVLSLVFMIIGVSNALAATLTVTPDQVPKGAYVNGPKGETDDNYYWQVLSLTSGAAHVSGQTITITFPSDVTLAKVNSAGTYDSHVTLYYTDVSAGGMTVAVTSATASTIVLTIGVADMASGDIVKLMFPVETGTATTSDDYYVTFSDATTDNIASGAGAMVTFREPGALQLFTFQSNLTGDNDSTSTYGDQYPAAAAQLFSALTDLIPDGGDGQVNGADVPGPDLDGTESSDDVVYSIWVYTDSLLSHVDSTAVLFAVRYDTAQKFTLNELANGNAATIATGGLPEGNYWLYITSQFTGDFPLARSDQLTIRHYPVVNLMGWDKTLPPDGFDNEAPYSDDGDATLDTGTYYDIDGNVTGTANTATDMDLYISVDDFDDNAQVYVFYSTNAGFAATDVRTSGSPLVVDGIGTAPNNATLLVSTLYENQEDTDGLIKWNWDVNPVGSSFIPAGDYTMYVVACDGKHTSFLKAVGADASNSELIKIRHSPSLTIDALTEYDAAAVDPSTADVTIDPSLTDIIMLSWGKNGVDGDKDIDDSATIEFYIHYSSTSASPFGSTDAVALRAAASANDDSIHTHKICEGILEDLEGKANSYYAWNMTADYKKTGWHPMDGTFAGYYLIYAIIDENKSTNNTARVVALGDDGLLTTGETITRVNFATFKKFARLLDPPAEGKTINAEETYRIKFEANDYNQNGKVGIYIVNNSVSAGPTTTNPTTLGALAAGNVYMLTSTDGDDANFSGLATKTTTYYDLSIRTPGDATVLYTTDITNAGTDLSDGTYWVYIGVVADESWDGTETLYRAPGSLTLLNVATTPSQKNLTISPMTLSTAQGDTTTFSVMAADETNPVDLMDLYIAVEKAYWTVVTSSGPFTDAAGYGVLLSNQLIDDDANGRWLLRATVFNDGNPIDPADTGLGTALATFKLVSKGTTNALEASTSVYFVNEPSKGWVTKFVNDGADISIKTLSSSVKVVPRPLIEGIVEFEGRGTSAYTVTLELRARGSYVASTDTIFANANDTDFNTPGIQYVLDTDGLFTLKKAPMGEWDLVAVYNRYLSKKLEVGLYAGMDTVFVNFGKLLGGDCFGYTDSSGAVWPDNQIDTGDINVIKSAFLSTPDSSKWDDGEYNYKWADINEDNEVETTDLSMATAHVGVSGDAPVYKPVLSPVQSNLDAIVEFANVPNELKAGQSYTIQVAVRNTGNVRAYFVNMNYDKNKLAFNGITEGDFLAGDSYSFPVVGNGTVGLANSVFGDAVHFGDGILAEVTFTALKDGAFSPDILGIKTASFVNAQFMKETVINENPAGIDGQNVPATFNLTQNFPNPFNPTTTISFAIPEQSNVELRIYDILGRHVNTLVSGAYAPGNYAVRWNATDMYGNAVSNGVYFYTIHAGNYHATKRMLFIK
ncbi:T9SS type A sorting domain-containing protein [bacterium]|nr:T9SS type A sorting domain-containing protein [bacterium]